MSESALSRTALILCATVLVAGALYFAASIVTPLVLALFLVVLIDSLARFLQRRVPLLPEWADMPLALLIAGVGFAAVVFIVIDNAAAFSTRLIAEGPRLNQALGQVCALVGVAAPPSLQSLISQINPGRYLGDVARAMQSIAAGAVYVLIYSGFLIASRGGFVNKVAALWPDAAERRAAVGVFNRIRDGVERYLWIQTISGGLIALLSFALMAALGLDNAAFWAFLIFILVFIPVVGGLVAAVLPPLFALVQFPGLAQPIILFVGLQAVFFVVGSILLPRMQRDGLNIDPVVVLLSLAFWGAVWGVAGMFLSTPLTVTAIIILSQFESSRWIAILLSGDGSPQSADPEAPSRTKSEGS